MPTIKLHWWRLHGPLGQTYFKLFREGTSGGAHIALVERPGAHWRYSFTIDPLKDKWGHTGSPVRSRRLAEEILYKESWRLFEGAPFEVLKDIFGD